MSDRSLEWCGPRSRLLACPSVADEAGVVGVGLSGDAEEKEENDGERCGARGSEATVR
jgi:hypothetical protein